MEKYITKQGVLFYDYTLEVEQTAQIDQLFTLLNESGVNSILAKACNESNFGRPSHDELSMLACILYGFAMRRSTLRELETSCKYDIRFKYIMNGKVPSHLTFGRFINTVIKPNMDEIFASITKAIYNHFNLSLDDCFIDGTKIEADANKYKFVWKPTKHHENLSNKARKLLTTMGLQRGVPAKGNIPSSLLASKVIEADARHNTIADPKEQKAYGSMVENLIAYLERSMNYEEQERICGPNRNSYYKTDHDATAMCLKQDYYSGLGSNMHAAYQVQLIISSGIIASYYVSQDRTDIYSFVPAMERLHAMYNIYPKRICADAGYGCLENYSYCDKHGIEAFVKYQAWEGEMSGRRPSLYELNEDGTITCLGGRTGHVTEIKDRHHKCKGSNFYIVEDCHGCPFMIYCRQFMKEREGSFKVFEINPKFQTLKQEARDRLLSVEGIEMRVNRSCQVEGGFGILKQDLLYTRFRRTGLNQVRAEFMLTALGANIRKYMKYCNSGLKNKYWTAPENTLPEKPKKPSAKRLANRVMKQRKKSKNEIARDYNHKST